MLDYNYIGSEGMRELSKGLEMNSKLNLKLLATIRKLSLNYCKLDLESVKYLQDILSFVECDLRYLFLEGNNLRNQGYVIKLQFLESSNYSDL